MASFCFPCVDLNLLDWGSHNILAVALHNSVYLWDATKGDIILLMRMEREEDYICSLSWTKDGSYLAVGTSDCKVQVCLSDVNLHQIFVHIVPQYDSITPPPPLSF